MVRVAYTQGKIIQSLLSLSCPPFLSALSMHIGFYFGQGYVLCQPTQRKLAGNMNMLLSPIDKSLWLSLGKQDTESKRLLTLMIWVRFPPAPNWLPSNCCLVMALVQRMISSDGDRQGLNRQMVVRSNNECLQVSAQTNWAGGQWSLSVKDIFIDSRRIHH